MILQAMKDLREFAVNLAETLPEELYDQDIYYHHNKGCGCLLGYMDQARESPDFYNLEIEFGISQDLRIYIFSGPWGIVRSAEKLNLSIPISFTAWDAVDRIDNLINKESNEN